MQRPFSETACMIKIPGQELNFVQRPLTKNHILHHKKMITKQLIPNAFLPNCLEDQKRASLFVIHALHFPELSLILWKAKVFSLEQFRETETSLDSAVFHYKGIEEDRIFAPAAATFFIISYKTGSGSAEYCH